MAGVMRSFKRQVRDIQTFFPFVRSAKFGCYNLATERFGWRVEPEFKLLAAIAPVELAVDVGGNWGQSVYALKRYAKPRQIITIEPNPVLGARLARVFKSDHRVMVKQVGLSDERGAMTLHIPRYRSFVYDGLASLDRDAAADWLTPERVARFSSKKLSIDTHNVAVEMLDQYGVLPDVLKIDVQGLESQVARGGIATLTRAKPVMIVEAPTAEFVEIVAAAGLVPYRWTGAALRQGDTGGVNTMFLSDQRKQEIERWLATRGRRWRAFAVARRSRTL